MMATIAMTSDVGLQFMQWTSKNNKEYKTLSEYQFRFNAFKLNLLEVRKFNRRGTRSRAGLNRFSDWTEEEWIEVISAGDTTKY
jgi:hypothetical protein